MKRGIVSKYFILVVMCLLFSSVFASAEVLTLNLNQAEFEEGKTARVFGYVLDDSLGGKPNNITDMYLDGVFVSTQTSDSEGFYEEFLTNLTAGIHNVSVNTSSSTQVLPFTVYVTASIPSYQIIASSLTVPYKTHTLNFTVKKYSGSTLSSDTIEYEVFHQNGSLYTSGNLTSDVEESLVLPQIVGSYTITLEGKKSFVAQVSKFDLKFKISDIGGNFKEVFKPNGIAYFEVEGFSNGQKITNATVTAEVTSPSGAVSTVSFVETEGTYNGNTNVTLSGTPITLMGGDYDVEFIAKDPSNNEQRVKGFFKVLGLAVDLDLQNKKPYVEEDTITFDVIVKNLEDGTLVNHSDVVYTIELEKDGKFYDTTFITPTASSNSAKTSLISFDIPSEFDDGDYFLNVKANSNGKLGYGKEYFLVRNTEFFIELSDNYGWYRDSFQPGELAKLQAHSEDNITFLQVFVYDELGALKSQVNISGESTSMEVTFNVPSNQDDYFAEVHGTINGEEIIDDRWFAVQNYFSFLDVKNLDNQFQFMIPGDEGFLTEIRVMDVAKGEGVDLSNFVVKFDRILNEETEVAYTSIKATENSTYSNRETGQIVFNIASMNLPNGHYKIEYTLIDENGKSFKGKGWFGVSSFFVDVSTYSETSQRKEVFSPGDTINVSVNIGTETGNATIYREFFDPITFEFHNGEGSTLLTASANELPSETGWYPFGVEVELNTGDEGFGEGWFEIRSLNFRSIVAKDAGEFSSGDDVIVDVVVEQSGVVVEGADIYLERVVRAQDWQDVSATAGLNATDSQGRAALTITPGEPLPPGDYFADIRAEYQNDMVWGGLGFRVTGDDVLITIDSTDNSFAQTETVPINVKVIDSSGSPKENVTVSLVGIMNLETWGPVPISKAAVNTSSSGIATFSLSAANYNPGRYAPIINISTIDSVIVGFGDGEFEIKPFDSTLGFQGDESFAIAETILVDVTIVGTVTVTAEVKDMDNNVQTIDYFYSDGVLTINNDLNPGEYFLEITITSGTKSKIETLWFEVQAPWAQVWMDQNNYAQDSILEYDYSIFTFGAQGWLLSEGTLNVVEIENMWTGVPTPVDINISATGEGDDTLDLAPYNLAPGDYLLRFNLIENPQYEEALYFRVEKDFFFTVDDVVSGRNVTLNVTAHGLSDNINYTLTRYFNFHEFEEVVVGTNNDNGVFTFNDLSNGFYQAQVEIRDPDTGEFYQVDAHFDVWIRDVNISAPWQVNMGDTVTFNITSTIDTNFWIMDPFSQQVLVQEPITAGNLEYPYDFSYSGRFMYSYGDDKWAAFSNAEEIEVIQMGFNVWFPMRWRYQTGEDYEFNISTPMNGTNVTLRIKSHFSGNVTVVSLGKTHLTPDTEKTFTVPINISGPQDWELTLDVPTGEKPKMYTFVDSFPDQYEINAWNDGWEYKAGETVNVKIEVRDIINDQQVAPTGVVALRIENPFGADMGSGALNWDSGNLANITTGEDWLTGHYHVELNVSKDSTDRIQWFDFFVRGNDNLELYWWQNQWDFVGNEVLEVEIEAKDAGIPKAGVLASLDGFEERPDNWETPPTSHPLGPGSYTFSTIDNKTDSNGRVTFSIELSQAGLSSGGFDGRLNVGGQIVWFGFNLRAYGLDTYTNEWEYGITDTIELNIRARNMNDWTPLLEDGNVTIKEIRKHDPGTWEPVNVSLAAFGLDSNRTTMNGGEALIEMIANNSILNIARPYEFEVWLEVELPSGTEEGWGWFRLSNSAKPGLSIIDGTDTVPESFFGNQEYTLLLTGPDGMNATLRNMWGPESKNYDLELESGSEGLEVNFTTPEWPGMYELEVEVIRDGGWPEYMHEQFTIGSGVEFHCHAEGNIVPGVNYTASMNLFGSGQDPFCPPDDEWCSERTWFGPMANKTITLIGMKDLSDFSFTDLGGFSLTTQTAVWPDHMIPANCWSYDGDGEATCNEQNRCAWGLRQHDQQMGCMDSWEYCSGAANTEEECDEVTAFDCTWNSGENMCQYMEDHMEDEMTFPGDATFTIDPELLLLEEGKKYDFWFVYTDEEGTNETCKMFAQVENFHVPISRREENLAANSAQKVWVKTQSLTGSPIEGCDVNFTGIYNEKDFSIVRTLTINSVTDERGELVFNYTAPSLPGQYIVEGSATCNISDVLSKQDLAYWIEVGARNLEVDVKSKFETGENIKVSVITRDRTGNPQSQKLELQLWHLREDYDMSIFPEGGANCIPLEAKAEGNWAWNEDSQFETDETGTLEVELCPLPGGVYDIEIFPMFDFMMGDMGGDKFGDDDFGFFGTFIVSDIDVTIESELQYSIGDEVEINLTAVDEFGIPINGTVVAFAVDIEDLASEGMMGPEEYVIYEYSGGGVELDENGSATFTFTVPDNVTEDEETINITFGPAFLMLMIQDSDGNMHSYEGMSFVIKSSDDSSLTADASVMTNELITVNVTTDNDEQYKAQIGSFFLTDNPDSMKEWMIQNGVLLENKTDHSEGLFKILTPNEPGEYYLGVPILRMGSLFVQGQSPMANAIELLITPIEVKLDAVNVTVEVEDLAGAPIEGALVEIGKREGFTNVDGYVSLEIPKGKKSIKVERKTGALKQFMQSDMVNFDVDKTVNISLYEIVLGGNLAAPFFNITDPSYEISTAKLRINVSVNNTGIEDLENYTIKAIALSGEESFIEDVLADSIDYVFFSNLYAGFEDDSYEVELRVTDEEWNGTAYFLVDDTGVNSTVGARYLREYTVETYATAGDGIDNDKDGRIDEEIDNNKDDDGDGLIDEDLEGEDYFEFCGNGFCSWEESEGGHCWEDCAVGSVCGDGFCDDDEEFNCPEDCVEPGNLCSPKMMCTEDGMWCNEFGVKQPASHCEMQCGPDACWKCSIGECSNYADSCEVRAFDSGDECDFKKECSPEQCWNCDDESTCDDTSFCLWEDNDWGGECFQPNGCDNVCFDCYDQTSCDTSDAEMDGVGCIWNEDNYGSWCMWNFTNNMQGEVGNIWLAAVNDTPEWNAIADMDGMSGNSGTGLTPGIYYILTDIGKSRFNLTRNGQEIDIFNNENGFWRLFSTSSAITFLDGDYTIELDDMNSDDNVIWEVSFGSQVEGYPELNLSAAEVDIGNNDTNIWFEIYVEDLSVAPFCDEQIDQANFLYWEVYLDTVSGQGCDDPDCLIPYDYAITFESDSGGNLNAYIDAWTGSDWGFFEDFEVNYTYLCETDFINLSVLRADVNASLCEAITVSFESSYGDGQDEQAVRNVENIQYILEGDCAVCGNGIVEAGEECDGINLGNENCNSGIFQGAFNGGTLSCNATCGFNTTACTVGGYSLSGQVNGSTIVGAEIDLYNRSNGEFVVSVQTNAQGDFSMEGLKQGVYDIEIYMPADHELEDIEILIDNLTIEGEEIMNVLMPHLYVFPFIGEQMVGGGYAQIQNGTELNFSVEINNTETYEINVSFEFNASEVGDDFNDSITGIPVSGGGLEAPFYSFTPTILGEALLKFNLFFEIPFNEVVFGTSALNNALLQVEVFNIGVLVNVTQGGAQCDFGDLGSCEAAPDCGWADPPGEDPAECVPCFEITAFGEGPCEASLGCHWLDSECVGDVQ